MLRATLLTIVLSSLFFVSTAVRADDAQLALNGLDPVALCHGEELEGKESIAFDHGHLRYHFTSEENLRAFKADPDRWGPQFDAHCTAMQGARANPSLFTVHETRIYMFGSEKCRTHFLEDPAAMLEQKPTVAILIFPGVELLDFAGPGEVFAVAGQHHFDVFTVAATAEPIISEGFVTITPEHTIESAPVPNILVIPGGDVSAVRNNKAVGAWIKRVAHENDHVLSVCNGALVLADLGLLDGLSATSHYSVIAGLQEFDAIDVQPEARFVDNGHIITTAGISAGIDGSLHLVSRLLGEEAAIETARYMEYDWRREGGLVTH